MLKRFFGHRNKDTHDISQTVLSGMRDIVADLKLQIDHRFHEVSGQIKNLEEQIIGLETKLLTKDLKDKQQYGLLHYKLHEAKNPKLDKEISELESKLRELRRNQIDQ